MIEAGLGHFGGNVLAGGVVGQGVPQVAEDPQGVADGARPPKGLLKQRVPVVFDQAGDKGNFDGGGHIAAVFLHIGLEILPLAVGQGGGYGLRQAEAGFLAQAPNDKIAHILAVQIQAPLQGVPVGVVGRAAHLRPRFFR